MISFVWEKFVQNTVRIKNVREEIVVHVSSQLRRRGIVGGIQTKPDRSHVVYRCFDTLLIGCTGKPVYSAVATLTRPVSIFHLQTVFYYICSH